MQLPFSMRDDLVDEIDEYLDAIAADPDAEAVALYVIEVLETQAEDEGIEEFVATLEEEGEVDGTLAEALEAEMRSNDEFEFTGEEVVSLLERMCGLEWDPVEEEEEEEDDDDEFDEFDDLDDDDDLDF